MDRTQGAGPRTASSPSPSSAPMADISHGGTIEPAGGGRGHNVTLEKSRPQQELPPGPQRDTEVERYEMRDPTRDLTYRARTFGEIAHQAELLGASRFTAIHTDGMRTPIRLVAGEWQAGDKLPAHRKPPPDLLTTRDEVVDLSAGLEVSLAGPQAVGRTAAHVPGLDKVPAKAQAKAQARIDAQAERAAMVARIENALTERYIIKRAPITLGDLTIGATEYRFRGDSSRVAFTESNLRLSTDTNSPSVARSMVDLAQARDWKGLRVSGSEDFRRLVWIEATVRGVKALGYEPNPADLSLLKREREARQMNRIEPAPQADSGSPAAATEKSSARGSGRKAVVAAIEALLIEKKVPQAKRQAVLAAAEERLAEMARAGRAPKVKVYDRNAERQLPIAPVVHEHHRQQNRPAPAQVR